MVSISLRWLCRFALCVVVAATIGCEMGKAVNPSQWSWWPSGSADTEYPVKTPAERIEELKSLASSAAARSPSEQESVARQLVESLGNEPDPLIRAATVRALGAFSTPSAANALSAALGDSESDVRIAACDAWARLGGPQAIGILSAALANDTDIDVRLAAARGLGELDDPQAAAALSAALEDPDPALQHRGVVSLRKLTKMDLGDDVAVWRAYLNGERPEPVARSIWTRLGDLF